MQLTDLISKKPGNVWCQFHHIEVDGTVYYLYQEHVFIGRPQNELIAHIVEAIRARQN